MMEDHYKSVNHHNNNNTTALTKARSVPTATEFASTAVAATLEMTAKMETIETISVAQTAGQTIPEMTIVTTTAALGKEAIIITEAVTTMTTAVSQKVETTIAETTKINVETPTTSVTVTSVPTESELASTTEKIMTTAMKDAVVLKKTAVTTARTIGKTESPTTKITTVPGVAKTIEEATIAAEIGVVTSITATTNVAATMTTVATTATTTALTNSIGQYISSNLYRRTENIHSRIRTQLEMNSSSFNLLEENNHNPPLFTEHMHSDNFEILRDQHRNSRNVHNLQRRLINGNSSHASFDYMFLNRRNIRSRHSSRIGGVGSISNNNNRNCNTTISIPTSVEKILEANEQSCKNEHDVNCPICFDNIQNVAYCFKCLQKFCLLCISKWTELRRICPLCNQYLRSIIYNVKSKNSYLVREEYGLVRRPEYYNNPNNNNNNNNDSDDDTTQSDEDDMYFIQDFIRRRYMSSRRSSDAFFQRTTPSQRRQNISRRPLLSSDTSGVLFRQRRDIHSTINTNSDISMQSTYRLFNTSQSESLSQERAPIMPREAAVAIIQRKDICSILWDLASQGIQMIVNFIHRIICYFGFTVSD